MERRLIHGFVDVHGTRQAKILRGAFDVLNSSNILLQTYCGKDINNNDITIASNKIPVPVIGIIKDDNNNPVINVKVTFIKDSTILNKLVNQYTAHETAIDYSMTDNNGNYIVFVEPGIYNIRIDNGKNPTIFTGQEIINGMQNQYYYLIDKGFIKKKYDDIIEFYGTDKKLIQGTMVDQNKIPIVNAEIIISKNNVIHTFIKTDCNGKYAFALENSTYDIRIRGLRQPIKICKNFIFENGKGFMNVLKEKYNLFKGEHGIWICS